MSGLEEKKEEEEEVRRRTKTHIKRAKEKNIKKINIWLGEIEIEICE